MLSYNSPPAAPDPLPDPVCAPVSAPAPDPAPDPTSPPAPASADGGGGEDAVVSAVEAAWSSLAALLRWNHESLAIS